MYCNVNEGSYSRNPYPDPKKSLENDDIQDIISQWNDDIMKMDQLL